VNDTQRSTLRDEFKGEYRCIPADLRNAPSGQSTGPVEADRPWEVGIRLKPDPTYEP
jgi:hypothetical protein